MFTWIYVAAVTAFMPSMERVAIVQTDVAHEHVRTVEAPRELVSLGWADEDEYAHF